MFIKRNIYEYDIHKANISCLLEMGEISKEQYDMLKDIPKDERSKFVAAFEKLEANTSKGYHLFVEKSLENFKTQQLKIFSITLNFRVFYKYQVQ